MTGEPRGSPDPSWGRGTRSRETVCHGLGAVRANEHPGASCVCAGGCPVRVVELPEAAWWRVGGWCRREYRLGLGHHAFADDADDEEDRQAEADHDRRGEPHGPAHSRSERPHPEQTEQRPEADHNEGQDVEPPDQDRSHAPFEIHIEQCGDEGVTAGRLAGRWVIPVRHPPRSSDRSSAGQLATIVQNPAEDDAPTGPLVARNRDALRQTRSQPPCRALPRCRAPMGVACAGRRVQGR